MTKPTTAVAAFVIALAIAPLSLPAQPAQPDTTELTNQARALTKKFAARMLKDLQGALRAGGPENAVKVCKQIAPKIAKEESGQSGGWKIGRTALRVRNPANAPDQFERKILEHFQAKAAAGANLATLDHAEIVGTGANRTFRYMKPIVMGKLCLTCHGPEVAPEIKTVLGEHSTA